MTKIGALMAGKFSRKGLMAVCLPLMALTYWILQLISIAVFPGDFGLSTHYISNIGNPYTNPQGWLIWSIGHSLNGVFMIPAVLYISREIAPDPSSPRSLSRGYSAGKRFLLICAIGWILMGALPQFTSQFLSFMHGVNAILILGGFYFGMFSWGFYILRQPSFPKWKGWIVNLVAYAVPAGFLIIFGWGSTVGLGLTESINGNCPWFFRIQLWEWLMMFFIYADFLILGYLQIYNT